MKVLITGAAGLIGSKVLSLFIAKGVDVIALDLGEQLEAQKYFFQTLADHKNLNLVPGTIMDSALLQKLMVDCDVVIHLAAMLGVARTESDRLQCLNINITGTENVLRAAVSNGVTRVVLASSSEVYGEPAQNPINEEFITQGKTVYAISKLAAEELAIAYNQMYPSLSYSIARFFNVYGEGQVNQFVLSKFCRALKCNEAPIIYGTGSQARSYCHAEDAAMGLWLMSIKNEAKNQIFNIGNSNEVHTLKDLVPRLASIMGIENYQTAKILNTFEGSDRVASREIHKRWCDTNKARKLLGFEATLSLEEGVKKMIAANNHPDDWGL